MVMAVPHELPEGQHRSTRGPLSKSQPAQLPDLTLERSRSHQLAPSSPVAMRPSASKSSHRRKQKEVGSPNLSHVPCKFFKQGTCTAGTNCIFSHNLDSTSEPSVCKYFLKGNCKFGAKCALLHTMSPYGDGRKLARHGHQQPQQQQQQPQQQRQQQQQQLQLQLQQQQQLQQQSAQHHHPYHSSLPQQRLLSSCSSSLPHALFQPNHASPPRSTFSHLTAALHRHHDPFSSPIPSPTSFASLFDEQPSSLFQHPQQPQQSRSSGALFQTVNSLRISPSPREEQPIGSPFQLSNFPPSTSSSRAISPCSFPQPAPTSSKHYLGLPSSRQGHHGLIGGTDDLNDAMLPSSLNDLLTPTELHRRRTREHQQQHQHASFSPSKGQQRSQKDSAIHSPFDGWSMHDGDDEDGSDILNMMDRNAAAIAIPGSRSTSRRPSPLQNYQRSNTVPPAHDDDVPFFMDPPDDVIDPRTFAFPSLVSLPAKST